MKKLIALLAALCLVLSCAALAEETVFTVRNNVTFGDNMEKVIASESVPYEEIERENTRGPVSFTEVEYEKVTENNVPADVKYLFVDDALAAVKINYDTRDITPSRLREKLTGLYGPSAPLDLTLLGSGVYALDDDGRPEKNAEAWTAGNVMIVLEQDDDDLDMTFIDLSAPWIKK